MVRSVRLPLCVMMLAAVLICAASASAATLQVGPTRTYKTVQMAAYAAGGGDTIEIDAGTYTGNGAVGAFSQSNLTIRGVGATRPILDAAGTSSQGKGILVLSGSNITVENLEFRNCRLYPGPGSNGAGIRFEGTHLTVRSCCFRDNDDGILMGANAASDILMEFCEFDHNGQGDGQTHNIYIGHVRTFTLRYSWSHNCYRGQEVKSRAQVNYILYNRITNQDGQGNYEIDLPNAGTSYIIGNLIQQSPVGTNKAMLGYAAEGATNPDHHLYVINNTFVNDRGEGTLVRNSTSTPALLQNNIFTGGGALEGPVTNTSNWTPAFPYFKDAANYDYHLTSSSTGAINTGTAPGVGVNGFALTPVSQYVHPCNYQARPVSGALEIGAYEYIPGNHSPTVFAGGDLAATEGRTVSFHAMASDPDRDPIFYSWTQTAGLPVALANAATSDGSFVAPTVASLAEANMTFTVVASDGKGGQSTDSINVRIRMLGDINQDDAVDVTDLLTFAAAWGSSNPGPTYDAKCDFSGDGAVDVVDLLILAENWTRTLQ